MTPCPPALILASTSPHRRALLQRLGLDFGIRAPEVAETAVSGEAPAARATRLAHAKAAAVAARSAAGTLVIGSDQVAELDGSVLHKPGTAAANIDQLLRCSGRRVRFHTAVTVMEAGSGRSGQHLEPFAVRFRTLEPERVARYVALEAPLDAAGGFYAEGLGITLFEALEGRDPSSLIGLPLMALVDLLLQMGLDPLAPA